MDLLPPLLLLGLSLACALLAVRTGRGLCPDPTQGFRDPHR